MYQNELILERHNHLMVIINRFFPLICKVEHHNPIHPKKVSYKYAAHDTNTNYQSENTASDPFQKVGNAVAQGMNMVANGITQTSKILSSGIMIGGSIAASGIEGAGKVIKSVVPHDLSNPANNPIASGFDMLTKVGKQAVDSSKKFSLLFSYFWP
jgi:hypothetical protein